MSTADSLRERISQSTKEAMKARAKQRVAALRVMNAELKRVEVDERRDLSDQDVLAVLGRMLKQRRDALAQFEQAGRDDLAAQERFEIDLIGEFMPQPLTDAEIEKAVDQAIGDTGATSMRDMGAVMAVVKTLVEGRADLGAVSALVKSRLG